MPIRGLSAYRAGRGGGGWLGGKRVGQSRGFVNTPAMSKRDASFVVRNARGIQVFFKNENFEFVGM